MIRLFVSDIDGCLADTYRPFRLDHFDLLSGWQQADGNPRISLCSGRAYPYVEALTQVLGLTAPVVFEGGGGMFDPVDARVVWHPLFSEDYAEQMDEVKRWMRREAIRGTSLMLDYSKRTQAGIIGANFVEVRDKVPVVERFIATNFPDLLVFPTPVSIDVSAPGITKKEAMGWIAREAGVTAGEMAYIGDTRSDIEALGEVKFGFAPANADAEVKAAAGRVMQGCISEGVVEAYRWCLEWNEQERNSGASA